MTADERLKPALGTGLWGNGRVVTHEPIIDSLGRWHGLLRLVVDDAIDPDPWVSLLPAGVDVKTVSRACEGRGQMVIYYKLVKSEA